MTARKVTAKISPPKEKQRREIVTAGGRKLIMEELGVLDGWRLRGILKDFGEIDATFNIAAAACSIREIDGFQWGFPKTFAQVEQAIERLGADGLAAINEEFATPEEGSEQPFEDQVKNSAGTGE